MPSRFPTKDRADRIHGAGNDVDSSKRYRGRGRWKNTFQFTRRKADARGTDGLPSRGREGNNRGRDNSNPGGRDRGRGRGVDISPRCRNSYIPRRYRGKRVSLTQYLHLHGTGEKDYGPFPQIRTQPANVIYSPPTDANRDDPPTLQPRSTKSPFVLPSAVNSLTFNNYLRHCGLLPGPINDAVQDQPIDRDSLIRVPQEPPIIIPPLTDPAVPEHLKHRVWLPRPESRISVSEQEKRAEQLIPVDDPIPLPGPLQGKGMAQGNSPFIQANAQPPSTSGAEATIPDGLQWSGGLPQPLIPTIHPSNKRPLIDYDDDDDEEGESQRRPSYTQPAAGVELSVDDLLLFPPNDDLGEQQQPQNTTETKKETWTLSGADLV